MNKSAPAWHEINPFRALKKHADFKPKSDLNTQYTQLDKVERMEEEKKKAADISFFSPMA